ncbi:DUF1850 domain-containing protein [Halopiger thermotolerans]
MLGASAIAVATAADEKTLVVADADTGEHLIEAPVDDGTEVTLAYTHSVEKTPVEDVYVVDGTELRMDRMVFYSHGAGLPTSGPIEETEDGFVVYPNASYTELGVVPGSVAGHELVVGDERYDLVARSDGPVVLSVEERGLSERLSDPLAADRPLEPVPAPDSVTPFPDQL